MNNNKKRHLALFTHQERVMLAEVVLHDAVKEVCIADYLFQKDKNKFLIAVIACQNRANQ